MEEQKKELTEKIFTFLENNIENLFFKEYWKDENTWKILTIHKDVTIMLSNKFVRDDYSNWDEYYMLKITKQTGDESTELFEIFNPECLEDAPHEHQVQIKRFDSLVSKIRSSLLRNEQIKEQKLINECLKLFK